MPRPLRKPKKFASATSQKETAAAPIVSTPVHHPHSNTGRLLSPNLSPIPDTANFPIFQDESVPLHDEFGFSRVRGIKKTVIAMPTEFDSDADIDDNQPSKEDDVDEDLYGVPPDPAATEDRPSPPAIPQSPKPRPKKAIRHPRTSELLCLLPTRKKRRPTRPQRKQRKQLRTLATSDVNSDDDTTRKRYGKTDAVDKENDAPEESSVTEPEIVERRTIVKQKFAEIDRWEMAFESVDLSFSSQNS